MPHYYTKFKDKNKFKKVHEGSVWMNGIEYDSKVFKLTNLDLGFDLFSVEIPGLLDREQIYSYPDDTERFIAFQMGVLSFINSWKELPEVVHCHDQHSGFIPFMMSRTTAYERLKNIPTVFTIHNGQYQGQFAMDKKHYLPPFHSYYNGLIEWDGDINPMAAAIKNAWKVTTVSPNYMKEITNGMRGLEELLKMETHKSVGILNGIDIDVWNPETDSMLVKNYNVRSVIGGKRANKEWLCKEFNLNPKLPLFAFIGRLVDEKGADILPGAIKNALSNSPDTMNVLILGSGDGSVEHQLKELISEHKGNYAAYIGYNEELSHRIYAGADFLLMPSRVEPCGLNQLYALRYGTVPIVRRVGGLKDTVIDIGDKGFGICHDQCAAWDIENAIERALEFYQDQDLFSKNKKEIMKIDHSWEKAAEEYIDLYKSL